MIEKQKIECCGCNACVQICPRKCISMQQDEEGFFYPVVNKVECIHCGLCEKVCPMNPQENKQEGVPKAYAAYYRDQTIRLQSSSGGIFSALAERVIQSGGAVFGAAMQDDCYGVHHILVESETELYKLRGSKYLQSTVGNTYGQAKQLLETGRQVLYSGTPCQIEGLKTFLQKNYENLFCIDLICHGVPSQKVWQKYAMDLENREKAKLKRVFFRSKQTHGWKNYSLETIFSNGKKRQLIYYKSAYGYGFCENVTLRPVCYCCPFKKQNRVADVTLADYWGVQGTCADMDDNKGLSLIIVHSEKGERALQEITPNIVLRQVNDNWLEKNSAMIHSVKCPSSREQFFKKLDCMSMGRALFTSLPMASKIKWILPIGLKEQLKKYIKRSL